MKLTFLGTSAANAFPEAFCQCENCRQARRLGGKSLRMRSSALVNDDLLIDLGPDIMAASHRFGLSLSGVRICLQTHAHADHLDPSHFLSRSPGYGVTGAELLHFYASRGSLREIARILERDFAPASFLDREIYQPLNLEIHTIEPLQSIHIGRYQVTAFPANHDPAVEPLLYALKEGRRTLFYGADTASLPDETWRGFHEHRLRFDLVILDHTYGPNQPGSDHLSAYQMIDHMRRMQEEGLLQDEARVFATHIAHEGNPVHSELSAFAARHGYTVAYDGLVVEVD